MIDILTVADDLYSAGQPSEAELGALARKGVRTVINLRHPTEAADFDEAPVVAAAGMRYVAIPIAGSQDLTRQTVARFSRELAKAQACGPVLVHCASANRVGALIALELAWEQGQTADTSLTAGRTAGLAGLEPAVIERLQQAGKTNEIA